MPSTKMRHRPFIIRDLRNNGINAIIMGGDSYVASAIIKTALSHANNIYFTTHVFLNPNATSPSLQAFIKHYRKKFHVSPQNAFSALGYDTVNLVAFVFKQANGLSAKDFIKALSKVKNFPGITGNISYTGGRHIPVKPVSIVSIMDDKPMLVTRLVPRYEPEAVR